jgi:hypothetical protein
MGKPKKQPTISHSITQLKSNAIGDKINDMARQKAMVSLESVKVSEKDKSV